MFSLRKLEAIDAEHIAFIECEMREFDNRRRELIEDHWKNVHDFQEQTRIAVADAIEQAYREVRR